MNNFDIYNDTGDTKHQLTRNNSIVSNDASQSRQIESTKAFESLSPNQRVSVLFSIMLLFFNFYKIFACIKNRLIYEQKRTPELIESDKIAKKPKTEATDKKKASQKHQKKDNASQRYREKKQNEKVKIEMRLQNEEKKHTQLVNMVNDIESLIQSCLKTTVDKTKIENPDDLERIFKAKNLDCTAKIFKKVINGSSSHDLVSSTQQVLPTLQMQLPIAIPTSGQLQLIIPNILGTGASVVNMPASCVTSSTPFFVNTASECNNLSELHDDCEENNFQELFNPANLDNEQLSSLTTQAPQSNSEETNKTHDLSEEQLLEIINGNIDQLENNLPQNFERMFVAMEFEN